MLSEQFGIKRCQFLDNLPFHFFFFFKIFLKFTFCRFFFLFSILIENLLLGKFCEAVFRFLVKKKSIGTFQPAFRRAGEGAPGRATQRQKAGPAVGKGKANRRSDEAVG